MSNKPGWVELGATWLYRIALLILLIGIYINTKLVSVDSVSTLPKVQLSALPAVTVEDLPSVNVNSLPPVIVQRVPALAISSLPPVDVGSFPLVTPDSPPNARVTVRGSVFVNGEVAVDDQFAIDVNISNVDLSYPRIIDPLKVIIEPSDEEKSEIERRRLEEMFKNAPKR